MNPLEKPIDKYKKTKFKNLISLIVCVMIMLEYPIWKEHKIFGIDLPNEKEGS